MERSHKEVLKSGKFANRSDGQYENKYENSLLEIVEKGRSLRVYSIVVDKSTKTIQ